MIHRDTYHKLLSGGIVFVNKALADHTAGHVGGGDLENPLQFGTFAEVLDAIAGFLFLISIPLAVVVVLIGAFQLLTAGGNEDRIRTGKKTITWAVIGFVVIVLAGSVANLVLNLLEVDPQFLP